MCIRDRINIDLIRRTIQRTRTEFIPNNNNQFTHQVNTKYWDWETDSERADRIKSSLLKVLNRLPTSKSIICNQEFMDALNEIRTLLKEAIDAVRGDAIQATSDRITKARSLMQSLADAY